LRAASLLVELAILERASPRFRSPALVVVVARPQSALRAAKVATVSNPVAEVEAAALRRMGIPPARAAKAGTGLQC